MDKEFVVSMRVESKKTLEVFRKSDGSFSIYFISPITPECLAPNRTVWQSAISFIGTVGSNKRRVVRQINFSKQGLVALRKSLNDMYAHGELE